jgi:hypothetical protein
MAYIDAVLAKNSAAAKATATAIVKENGLYKISLKVDEGTDSTNVDIYATLDGKKVFLRDVPLDVEAELAKLSAPATTATSDQAAATAEVTSKTDKPVVQLFVMANCPYGLQVEKGIMPAIKALGKTVDFKLEFCDYSMHGNAEVAEELNQTCIAQNEPTKLSTYLECYWKDANNATDDSACLKTANINVAKMKTCVSSTDKKFNVNKDLADKATWTKDSSGNPAFPTFKVFATDNTKYSVAGSPTIVINGETVSPSRDSASLLKTICSAFKTAPSECQAQLSSASPSAGFDSQNASASASNANCATTPAN